MRKMYLNPSDMKHTTEFKKRKKKASLVPFALYEFKIL